MPKVRGLPNQRQKGGWTQVFSLPLCGLSVFPGIDHELEAFFFFGPASVISYSHYFVKSKADLSPVGIPENVPVPQCSRDLGLYLDTTAFLHFRENVVSLEGSVTQPLLKTNILSS